VDEYVAVSQPGSVWLKRFVLFCVTVGRCANNNYFPDDVKLKYNIKFILENVRSYFRVLATYA
jgi:hypothetical protein